MIYGKHIRWELCVISCAVDSRASVDKAMALQGSVTFRCYHRNTRVTAAGIIGHICC